MSIRSADLVAEFRAETRDFDRGASRVDAVVRRLAGVDPIIQVAVDAVRAGAQLSGVSRQASALGALSPDVNVNADVLGAMGGLETVASAANALSAVGVNIDVDAQTGGALASLGEVATAVRALDATSVNMDVDVQTAGAMANLAGMQGAIAGTSASGLGMGASIAGGVAIAGGALAAGVGIAGGYGLAIAAGNEQAQISFETMLGSGEAAEAFLTRLKDFAATTPFEFPELQTAASSLISAGVEADKVIPIMTSLGNATSGMGTGSEGVKRATVALQQMSAAGKITGEDLNQLRDAGIPVFDLLAAATGKSKEEVSALAAAGKLGKTEMEALFSALESGAGLERFNGLMEKQSQSLTGIISTIKDTVGQGLAGAVAPSIPIIKAGLGDVAGVFGGFSEQIGGVFAGIAESVAPAIGPVLGMVASLATAVGPVIGVLAGVGGAIATSLAPVIADMAPVLGEIATKFGEFLLALVPLLPALLQLVAAALPILPPFIDLATLLASAVVPVLTTLLGILEPFAPIIALVVGAFALAGPVIGVVATVLGALNPVVLAIGAAIAVVVGIVKLLTIHWETIKNVAEAVWNFIGDLIGKVVGFIGDRINDAKRFLGDLIFKFVVFKDNIGEIVGNVIGFFGNLAGGIGNAIGDAIGFVTGIPGRIIGALGDVGRMLFDAGRRIIQGLIDGVMSMIGRIGDAIGGAVGKIRDFLPFSPAKEGPLSGRGAPTFAGRAISSMLAEGINAGLPTVAGAASRLAGTAAVTSSSNFIPSTPVAPSPMTAGSTTSSNDGGTHLHFYGPVVGGEAGMRELARKVTGVQSGRSYQAGG